MIAADFKPGDWVVYVPAHAFGDKLHEDCERGTVTLVNAEADIVFVRYAAEIHAKATSPEDLITGEQFYGATPRSPNAPMSEFREYLGDGAFVGFDGFNIVVTAENGIRATDIVYLDLGVYQRLVEWFARRIKPLVTNRKEG